MTGSPGRIVWLAVAAGFVADQLLSQLIASVGSLFDPAVAVGITFNSAASIITAILLVVSTGIGGWIAGRLAKQEYVLHGVLVGGTGVLVMLLTAIFGQQWPLANIVLQCVAIGLGGLGGWLSRWLPTRQQE